MSFVQNVALPKLFFPATQHLNGFMPSSLETTAGVVVDKLFHYTDVSWRSFGVLSILF